MQLSRPLFLVTILLLPAFAQSDGVELRSDKPGRAEVKVLGLILHADEATFNRETGELAMRGHIHVTLPAREDHTVVRYGAGVLLTDQPIGLTADRVTVRIVSSRRGATSWWRRPTPNCPKCNYAVTSFSCT